MTEGRLYEIALALKPPTGVALDAEWSQRVASRAERPVILGIRPEDIDVAPDEPTDAASTVRVRLDVVESLGNEAFLSARVEEHEIVARVPPRRLPRAGADVMLVFRRERLHFFDGETRETLRPN